MEYVYVMCEGKVRKSTSTFTYEQISEMNCDWARILPSGLVMFDVDDIDRGLLLLDILKDNSYHEPLKFNWVKSTKGYHFIFKTNKNAVSNLNKKFNWLGLELDIKGAGLNEKDKVSYESMRVHGVLRQEHTWNGERDILMGEAGSLDIEDLSYAPMWLYHLDDSIRNISSEKAKLYTLSKVYYPRTKKEEDEEKGRPDELIGDRNGFYFGIYMICAKTFGFTYQEYLEMVNIVNFEVADFYEWTDEKKTYNGARSISKEELEACSREEAWDGIEVKDDEIKQLLAIAEDLYISLSAIVDKKTGLMKVIDYTDNFRYYMVNDTHVEELLKTEYKGVKALTPQKEHDVITFLYEIAKGRRNEFGERASFRESDPKWYALIKDRKLVAAREERPLTREVYTNLVYNLRNIDNDL